MIAEHDVLICI